MRKEYFSSLEEIYGFTGNWAPSDDVQVGDWTDVEYGFIPWLKETAGIITREMEISKKLHGIMKGSLGQLDVKVIKKAPLFMSYNVSVEAGVSGAPISIKAQKKGGFFAIFQDIYEESADPVSFKDKLNELNKTSIAIVSGVTRVKKGILVIFSHNAASISLPINFSLDALQNAPAAINLDFVLSHQSEGVLAFQAEPQKQLIPFVKIHIAEREKQSRFDGSFVRDGNSSCSENNYSIEPFSYTNFLKSSNL